MYGSRTGNDFADEIEDILARNEYNDKEAKPVQGKASGVHSKTNKHSEYAPNNFYVVGYCRAWIFKYI